MSEIVIQIDMMIESLEKKRELLKFILKYTKEQAEILSKEEMDLRSFNNIMKNKQIHIDKLIQLDQGFESLFGRIKTAISSQTEIYRESIVQMQKLIKETTDLGIEVQVQEERNKVQFDMKSKGVKGEVKAYRSHKSAMSTYQNNYIKSKKADQPHFFDSKK